MDNQLHTVLDNLVAWDVIDGACGSLGDIIDGWANPPSQHPEPTFNDPLALDLAEFYKLQAKRAPVTNYQPVIASLSALATQLAVPAAAAYETYQNDPHV